jgi:hypothetical protein
MRVVAGVTIFVGAVVAIAAYLIYSRVVAINSSQAAEVQAWASIAAVFVAGVALLVAVLAWQAEKSQADAARDALALARDQLASAAKAEASRQRDARVEGIRPLLVGRPTVQFANEGVNRHQWVAILRVPASDTPVLDLRVILHGRLADGSDDAEMSAVGSIPPGSWREVHLVVTRFHERTRGGTGDDGVAFGVDPHVLELQYFGQLGQWVVEAYEWDFGAAVAGSPDPRWRHSRLTIDHKVKDGEPFDLRYE